MTELTQLPPAFWVAAPLTILFAYTVFGLSGFGTTAIAVPILAHWLPLTYLVPLMVLTDLAGAAFIGRQGRRHVSLPELKRLLPFMAAGIVVGVTVLVSVPKRPLDIALGALTIAIGLNAIANPVPKGTISAWWCVPTGIVAGAFAAAFGAGGPIHVAYLSGRLKDKDEIRSTISTLISISAAIRAASYAVAGLLLKASVFAGLVLVAPIAGLGIRLGSRLHERLTQAQVRRFVGAFLITTGSLLLWRALRQGS